MKDNNKHLRDARWKSRQPLRKPFAMSRSVVGQHNEHTRSLMNVSCSGCGFHNCSCASLRIRQSAAEPRPLAFPPGRAVEYAGSWSPALGDVDAEAGWAVSIAQTSGECITLKHHSGARVWKREAESYWYWTALNRGPAQGYAPDERTAKRLALGVES